jgi:hypothetical protein
VNDIYVGPLIRDDSLTSVVCLSPMSIGNDRILDFGMYGQIDPPTSFSEGGRARLSRDFNQ